MRACEFTAIEQLTLKSLSILQELPAPSINHPQLTGKVGKMHLFVFKAIYSGNLDKT